LIQLPRTFLFPSALGKGHFSHTQASDRRFALTNDHISVASVYGNRNVEMYQVYFFNIIIIWFVRLLALRPLLAYCASLG
jgi:hypothetical protein